MTSSEQRLKRYAEHASDESVRKIDAKLLQMHCGCIARIWNDVSVLWAMIKDPTAAWSSKAIAIGALLYLVSPLDAIPDFLPLLGLSDDAGVILAAVASLAVALARCQNRSDETSPQRQPGK
jgi:uncharacterized membrane protein YkvA (DUF1232 family)